MHARVDADPAVLPQLKLRLEGLGHLAGRSYEDVCPSDGVVRFQNPGEAAPFLYPLRVRNVPAGCYRLAVSAEGWQTEELQVAISDFVLEADLTLKPAR